MPLPQGGVGIHSRWPTTLALVCEEDEHELHEEFRSSAAVTCRCRFGPGKVLVHRLGCVAFGLHRIRPGEMVRIDRTGPNIRLVDTRIDDIVETARLALQMPGEHRIL